MTMRTVLLLTLFVILVIPGLVLGILASPWFFLLLFLLLVGFPFVLAPRVAGEGHEPPSSSPGPLVWALVGLAIVIALPVLILGLAVAPELFLLILLVMAPLLWLAFSPS
jgi:hypothetical protein